jgi:hypothetical protein
MAGEGRWGSEIIKLISSILRPLKVFQGPISLKRPKPKMAWPASISRLGLAENLDGKQGLLGFYLQDVAIASRFRGIFPASKRDGLGR